MALTLDRNLLNTVEKVAGAEWRRRRIFILWRGRMRIERWSWPGPGLNATPALRPYWKIDGEHAPFSSEATSCLVGANVARQCGLKTGSELRLQYGRKGAIDCRGYDYSWRRGR